MLLTPDDIMECFNTFLIQKDNGTRMTSENNLPHECVIRTFWSKPLLVGNVTAPWKPHKTTEFRYKAYTKKASIQFGKPKLSLIFT